MRLLFVVLLCVSIISTSHTWADDIATEIIPQKLESGKIQMFVFSMPSMRIDFLMKRHLSRLECGTHGCRTDFYKKTNDGGYEKMKFSMITIGPVYKKICKGRLSLVFSPGAGVPEQYGEWLYKEDKFEMFMQHDSLDAALVCP